ncbi:hypothetical protein PVAND_005634 [Polypedilum vanderplanki]|uniref:BHLH domain-containing protein n=1 Tax=Polypedilum vanderplanki TaxID=319348 RepID=A0A9J6C1M0_POLVA|nr:hypothetical protein PVAND_005634 [Polypedilum vanderplanki]
MNTIDRMYPNMSAAELSNIIMKGKGVNSMSSLLERDAGFCSGSSEHEDDHHSHDGLHSPTDASEDSVEVKFTPILKNKRKSSEPSRVVSDPEQGPLKKRFRYSEHQQQQQHQQPKMSAETGIISNHLHRPWALAAAAAASQIEQKPNPADILLRHPGVTTLHRAINSEQEEPLALIAKKQPTSTQTKFSSQRPSSTIHESSIESLIKKTQISRLHSKALDATQFTSSTSTSTLLPQVSSVVTSPTNTATKPKSSQRNYKNMTRERRIEANARERTRVHTISAAYDTLRHAIPSYSSTQKLSKLSVLRVACSYILTLSRLAGEDFSIDQSEPDIGDCVDAVTRTIQTEGKLRRKKDE